MSTPSSNQDFSIIAMDKFIQATRDSGYKGTSSAIAELVDNALEAGARRVDIRLARITNDGDHAINVTVQDDGAGMDPVTLRHALRFGGSTPFNARAGLGRFGMGLPNSSLSQARRVTVYTWQAGTKVLASYLDVDEIAGGAMTEVPVPQATNFPFDHEFGESGTVVVWSRCDRLDNRRISTMARKIIVALGRRFRYFIWDGVRITVNSDIVEPLDPLFLHPGAAYNGAELFGETLEYEVHACPDSSCRDVGIVRVRFSELPVHAWHNLSSKEKRRLGISEGAGVSVIRAGREVDYGWFFLRNKRRENYDDWWRCEIHFDPVLDDAFGMTHTKQQIRPKSYVLEALSPDIEAVARALNGRARKAHFAAKAAERFSESEKLATKGEMLLKPLPDCTLDRDRHAFGHLKARHPVLRQAPRHSSNENGSGGDARLYYTIINDAVRDQTFFTYARDEGRLVLALNPNHPFYKQIYGPLTESDTPKDRQLRTQLELLLLSFVRAEAAEQDAEAVAHLERHRRQWSNTLATFLNATT